MCVNLRRLLASCAGTFRALHQLARIQATLYWGVSSDGIEGSLFTGGKTSGSPAKSPAGGVRRLTTVHQLERICANDGNPSNSISFVLVDDTQERAAIGKAAQVLAEQIDGPVQPQWRTARGVGSDDNVRVIPERTVGGQWFRGRYVKPGAANEPLIQGLQQGLVVDDGPPGNVDQ